MIPDENLPPKTLHPDDLLRRLCRKSSLSPPLQDILKVPNSSESPRKINSGMRTPFPSPINQHKFEIQQNSRSSNTSIPVTSDFYPLKDFESSVPLTRTLNSGSSSIYRDIVAESFNDDDKSNRSDLCSIAVPDFENKLTTDISLGMAITLRSLVLVFVAQKSKKCFQLKFQIFTPRLKENVDRMGGWRGGAVLRFRFF